MIDDSPPSPPAIREQLARILQHPDFRGSVKQRQFLNFVVAETLDDRASQIKGYTIAVAVYGRPETFDPQVDPIVRVEAGRLRRALDQYYLTAGSKDPVHIEIPKGAYVPTFRTVSTTKHRTDSCAPDEKEKRLPKRPSIALMPLVNLTADPAQDYFIDGLTEEITTELARYQDFNVIASQSTLRFKGREADSITVGRELGVRFLLSGSVRKDVETVKITIGLIDAISGLQIWGENYKRELTPAGLIAIQEVIGQRVVGAVADHFGLITRRLSMESRKKAPADLEAYDATLRFYRYETELTPEAFEAAFEALERAVEIEPDYGLAWSMLGHLHADNYALGFCEIEAPLEKALTFAQRGAALAPGSQFASDALTLVYFHQGNKEMFLRSMDMTISLNPNSPYIVGVAGWHLMLYGEWERGLSLLRKGMKLNPYYPSWFHMATYMDAYRRGAYEKALAEAIKFNFPGLFIDPMLRAAALGQMGKHEEGRTALGELLELVPDFTTRGRELIGRYVKADGLTDSILEGLRKAGLANPD